MYSLLYEHDQLNGPTHEALHEMFGIANIHAMEHLALMVRAGGLRSVDGQDIYLPHLGCLAIPITFIHGAENACFLPESTAKTMELLAQRNGTPVPTPRRPRLRPYRLHIRQARCSRRVPPHPRAPGIDQVKEPIVAAPTDLRQSSRHSEEGAGWRSCTGPGTWKDDVPAGTKSLSWVRPSTLWQSRNDTIANVIADPTAAARARWVELARRRAEEAGAHSDFVISRPAGDTVSVLVIGDTGEGDNSQYAVAGPLVDMSKDADFAVICSDVVYPTGDLDDYGRAFHHPYRNLKIPIYAVPGNHDWYDGLHGFMHYFCRLDDAGYRPEFGRGPAALLAGLLWRRPPRSGAQTNPAATGTVGKELPPPNPLQPAPYFAIDAGPVRFVGIDTGITGEMDEDQYHWLKRVSLDAAGRPKILLTGKPIYVDNKHHPGRVVGTAETVDDIVTDPRANYKMAIGGDVHNYQRYPVAVPDGRTIQYVVSGGGGAYLHATHRIPPVNVNGVDESTFRCYPLRRDSLARFSQIIDERLSGGSGTITIDALTAGRYYEQRGVTTSRSNRPVAERLSLSERIKAEVIQRIPAGRFFHRMGSEVFDFDEPPFFKQFLRIDANSSKITVSCFGVTGCADTEHAPPIEDQFTIPL